MTDIDLKNEAIDIVLTQKTSPIPQEHFTIGSIKAAEILGVNRTRLSQLTTQGIFPYERRKIDARSRLFYRLNDLLNYQRKSTFGNLPHPDHALKNESVPLLPPHACEHLTHAKENSAPNHSPPSKSSRLFSHDRKTKKIRNLENASVLKIQKNEREKMESLHKTVEILKDQMSRIINFIDRLENQINQEQKRKLNSKKVILRRPRPKRMLKLIKR